jgi:hypothetical protein
MNNTNIIDSLVNDLDKCGEQYCGSIITNADMKIQGEKFLKFINKKCKSKVNPATESEYNLQQIQYNTCFTKYKNRSKYHKRLTKRKKCEDKKCKNIQTKINSFLMKSKLKSQTKSKKNP